MDGGSHADRRYETFGGKIRMDALFRFAESGECSEGGLIEAD